MKLTPKSPAMLGTDTLVMVRSRMFMNEPKPSAKVASANIPPRMVGDGGGADVAAGFTTWRRRAGSPR